MKTNPTLSRRVKKLLSNPSFFRKQKIRPWQAVLFFVAVTAIGGLASVGSRREDDEFYENQRLPVWAPPGWLFGPAWTFINICLTWGGYRLLNKSARFPHRRQLLNLQGISWVIYVTFSPIYFGWRSPILAHIWTQGGALVALRSLLLARRGDRKLAYAYIPLTAWTWFASTVSGYQALYNADPFLQTPAPLALPKSSEAPLQK